LKRLLASLTHQSIPIEGTCKYDLHKVFGSYLKNVYNSHTFIGFLEFSLLAQANSKEVYVAEYFFHHGGKKKKFKSKKKFKVFKG
jgi:hypothetical protein